MLVQPADGYTEIGLEVRMTFQASNDAVQLVVCDRHRRPKDCEHRLSRVFGGRRILPVGNMSLAEDRVGVGIPEDFGEVFSRVIEDGPYRLCAYEATPGRSDFWRICVDDHIVRTGHSTKHAMSEVWTIARILEAGLDSEHCAGYEAGLLAAGIWKHEMIKCPPEVERGE